MGNIIEIEIKELDSMKAYKYLGVEENHNTEYRNEKKIEDKNVKTDFKQSSVEKIKSKQLDHWQYQC
jgi:hypothetical protein